MAENRFTLHIIWYNYEKTEGEATLRDNGQPLLVSEDIEDMRNLKDLLNQLYYEMVGSRLREEDRQRYQRELKQKNKELTEEVGKLSLLYKAKCKTEENLTFIGVELEKENKRLKTELRHYVV